MGSGVYPRNTVKNKVGISQAFEFSYLNAWNEKIQKICMYNPNELNTKSVTLGMDL